MSEEGLDNTKRLENVIFHNLFGSVYFQIFILFRYMEMVRQIIREELRQTLFGQPIPTPGEKGYLPDLHNLEMVNLRASHYKSMNELYETFVFKVSSLVNDGSVSNEDKISRIQSYIDLVDKDAAKLQNELNSMVNKIGA